MVPSRLFRSRWAALLWAAGIVWTARDVATANRPSPTVNGAGAARAEDATGEAVTADDLAVLANIGD